MRSSVYPELVIRDQEGRIDGVRYDELAPMLLNEMQQQHTQMTAKIDAQAAQIRDLTTRVAQLSDVRQQMAEMRAALTKLQATREYVVQR